MGSGGAGLTGLALSGGWFGAPESGVSPVRVIGQPLVGDGLRGCVFSGVLVGFGGAARDEDGGWEIRHDGEFVVVRPDLWLVVGEGWCGLAQELYVVGGGGEGASVTPLEPFLWRRWGRWVQQGEVRTVVDHRAGRKEVLPG